MTPHLNHRSVTTLCSRQALIIKILSTPFTHHALMYPRTVHIRAQPLQGPHTFYTSSFDHYRVQIHIIPQSSVPPHPIDIKPQSTQCPTPCRHYAPIILVSPQPSHIMPLSSECPPHLICQASIAIESPRPVRRPRWSVFPHSVHIMPQSPVSSQYTSGLITTVSPHSAHIRPQSP